MGLEEIIREAAKKGLTHLSLHPVHSEDNKTVYWRCTATPSTMHKYVHVTELDPVAAISAVLKAMPKAASRAKPAAGAPEPKREVTATVNDPVDLHDGPNDEWSRFK